ncbi:MAG: nickel pincer cofactor biosynthesis protein LarB [Promethearchaeota archaeon]|nr:MAG: nickel pincer cofactor biosynthesis protein LarB [Candidatus Lokiarchaeota archaeon]
MKVKDIEKILKEYKNNKLSLEEAENFLRANFIKNVKGLAQLDVFRETRTGVPEVIFAQNKDPKMVLSIVNSFLEERDFVLISKFTSKQKILLIEEFKEKKDYEVDINEMASIITIKKQGFSFQMKSGVVGIMTAGSSDISIAEEAKTIAIAMGCKVITSYDVGIAGIHRIFDPLSQMIQKGVDVIVVCAGMEGTLPGVVAALVNVTVIGVPVSSGYGLGGEGKGALTTMLQSCSPGLLVVNIDNGFGAGVSGALIANRVNKK